MHSLSVLFLCPYPFDEAPSQRFRFEQYFDILQNENIWFDQAPFLSKKAWNSLYKDGKSLQKAWHILIGFIQRFRLLFKLSRYTYVFIHREASPLGPPIFEWIIARLLGKKVIYDFDDAIWLEDPSEQGSLRAKIKWKQKVKRICQWSYKVSCGNQYLADFARHHNARVFINPTTIDTSQMHNPDVFEAPRQTKSTVVIGWTGTHSTLPYLKPIVPVLEELATSNQFVTRIIANRAPDFDIPNLEFVHWNKKTEIADLMPIDIGIMPLTDDIWSKGKCGFKALQYMALKKSTIASPVGVNKTIISDAKNGFLCHTHSEWKQALTTLLSNQQLRESVGEEARKTILAEYSVKSNTQNFLSLFS